MTIDPQRSASPIRLRTLTRSTIASVCVAILALQGSLTVAQAHHDHSSHATSVSGLPDHHDEEAFLVADTMTNSPALVESNMAPSTGDVVVVDEAGDSSPDSISSHIGVMPSDFAPWGIATDSTDAFGTSGSSKTGSYSAANRIISALKAPRAKKQLRTLVIRAYWKGNGRDNTDTKTLRQLTTKADKVLRAASRGKVGIKPTLTGWIKIARTSCDDVRLIASRAVRAAAAKNRSHRASRFDRVVIYFKQSSPCSSWAGRGEMPGKYVWINGVRQPTVLAHELGHTFGLAHANMVYCSGSQILAKKSKKCRSYEYGDLADLMGAGPYVGLTQAAFQRQAKWLSNGNYKSIKRRSASVSIKSRSSNKGVRAVRVRTKKYTYWVEYRTQGGLDKVLDDELTGVTVSLAPKRAGQSANTLDMQPQNSNLSVALPLGSSWTSPDNVRFTVKKLSAKKAKVKIQRKARKAKKPSAPRKIFVSPGDSAAAVTLVKGKDRGSPIQGWKLRAVPTSGGNTKGGTVTATAKKSRAVLLQGLTNGTTYRIQAKARNEKGWSKWSKPVLVKPGEISPTISVTSPVASRTYSTIIPVRMTATASAKSSANITSLEAYLDVPWSSEPAYVSRNVTAKSATLNYDFETEILPDGKYPMRFVARDSLGRVSVVSRTITVAGKSPRLSNVSTNLNGTTLSVKYTMTKRTNNAQGVLIVVRKQQDGSAVIDSGWLYPESGVLETWNSSLSGLASGTYTVQVIALDENFWPRDQLPGPQDPTWGYHTVSSAITVP